MTTDVQTATISLTPAAIGRVKDLLQEQDKLDHGLRVFVAGKSCAGMQYGMSFDLETREQDQVFEDDGVKLIVDSVSLMYMAGATIDFVESVQGGAFRIDNPNVDSACGSCGQASSSCG